MVKENFNLFAGIKKVVTKIIPQAVKKTVNTVTQNVAGVKVIKDSKFSIKSTIHDGPAYDPNSAVQSGKWDTTNEIWKIKPYTATGTKLISWQSDATNPIDAIKIASQNGNTQPSNMTLKTQQDSVWRISNYGIRSGSNRLYPIGLTGPNRVTNGSTTMYRNNQTSINNANKQYTPSSGQFKVPDFRNRILKVGIKDSAADNPMYPKFQVNNQIIGSKGHKTTAYVPHLHTSSEKMDPRYKAEVNSTNKVWTVDGEVDYMSGNKKATDVFVNQAFLGETLKGSTQNPINSFEEISVNDPALNTRFLMVVGYQK